VSRDILHFRVEEDGDKCRDIRSLSMLEMQ